MKRFLLLLLLCTAASLRADNVGTEPIKKWSSGPLKGRLTAIPILPDGTEVGAGGGSGATLSFGTGVPSGGANGDVYYRLDTPFGVYKKVSGSWVSQVTYVLTADSRLSDTRTPTDSSVTAAKIADALKPSVSASAGTEALRALGTSSITAAAGNDSRLSDTRTPTDTTVSTAKLVNNAVTNGKMAQMAAHTFKGNATGTSADPSDNSFGSGVDTAMGIAVNFSGGLLTAPTQTAGTTGTSNTVVKGSVVYFSTFVHGTTTTLTMPTGPASGDFFDVILIGANGTSTLTTSATVYRFGDSASGTLLTPNQVGGSNGNHKLHFWYDSSASRWWYTDTFSAATNLAGTGSGGVTGVAPIANGGTNSATAYGAFDNLSVHGADVASASTINLDTATGSLVDVTGTTPITAVTLSDGRMRTVRFTGALTLTAGANLILPNGGSNISTVAGDVAVFRGYASSVVRCVIYQRLSGAALSGSSGLGVPGSNGMIYGTTGGSSTGRTLTSNSTTYHTWTNGDGASGNPTSDLTTRVKAAVDGVCFVLTIDAVADSMDYTIGFVPAAFTITDLWFVHNGTTSSPSITPMVKYGTDRSSGTSVVTSPAAVTSTTTGSHITSFNNSAPSANSYLWMTTASKSGTTDKFTVVIVGHY